MQRRRRESKAYRDWTGQRACWFGLVALRCLLALWVNIIMSDAVRLSVSTLFFWHWAASFSLTQAIVFPSLSAFRCPSPYSVSASHDSSRQRHRYQLTIDWRRDEINLSSTEWLTHNQLIWQCNFSQQELIHLEVIDIFGNTLQCVDYYAGYSLEVVCLFSVFIKNGSCQGLQK